jgi:2-C-methyl-D-erythritol 2,4-cyclodiphosphate synthase
VRVGLGYDSHPFAPGGPVVLGGVEIPHARGLEGHSDADALAHAVTDAILGAAGLGDMGAHFPPSDERWAGADSIELLRDAVAMISGRVVNVDSTVICEEPKIAPHRERMEARLTDAVGAPVAVKATTNEGMGFIGRGEGIAAIAVALVEIG